MSRYSRIEKIVIVITTPLIFTGCMIYGIAEGISAFLKFYTKELWG